ncbi:MAG: DUF1203 domain-containing protein [Myxococcota bacterium]
MKKTHLDFRITGLDPSPFVHLYGLSDSELGRAGIVRLFADAPVGYPDRIGMRDVQPGESVLLCHFEHLTTRSPYRSSHAIFIREFAMHRYDECNSVPDVMRIRMLSVRAYDELDMMLDAELVAGRELERCIERLFSNDAVSYLHAHNAVRGCYSGRIDRG